MNLRLLLITSFAILLSFQITAQHWTGQVNSDWNNSANWSEWPIGGEDIIIDPGQMSGVKAMPFVNANSVFTPAEVNIKNGAVLTINALLNTEDDVTITGPASGININNGGTFDVAVNDNGRLIVDGGSMSINNGILNIGQRFNVGEGSAINLFDGTIDVKQRIIIGGGGLFVQHQGTVSVGETLAIGDGAGDISSLYELRGGILNVTGEMGFENEAGNFSPTFLQSGGSLLVSGDLTWFGESPGSGSPKFIQSSGNSIITGNIENLSGSTVNLFISLSGSAHMDHNGSRLALTQELDSFKMSALATIDFTNVTIDNDGVFNAHDSQAGFTGSNKIDGDGQYQFADVFLHAGELIHADPEEIFIGGNFVLNGMFKPTSNKVSFNGHEEQVISNTISNNNPIEFYDFTVDNNSAEGLTLHLPISIEHHLQLNKGRINSQISALLNIEKNATSNEGSTTSFVNGPMSKSELNSYIFPVGKNNKWARIAFNASNTGSNPVIVEYFDTGYDQPIGINPPLKRVSDKEYWLVTATSEVETNELTLYWEEAGQSNISGCTDLIIAYSGGQQVAWDGTPGTITGSCEQNDAGTITSVAPIPTARLFTFGFITETITTVQTIDLCEGESVQVGTNIYGETGTYTDTLSSGMGQDSIVITILTVNTVDAMISVTGSVIQANNLNADRYSLFNCNSGAIINTGTEPAYVVNESGNYALIVEDEGCIDTSECVQIIVLSTKDLNNASQIRIFPNPVYDELNIRNDSGTPLKSISLMDVLGNNIPLRSDLNKISLMDQNAGIYFLKIELINSKVLIKKIIKL